MEASSRIGWILGLDIKKTGIFYAEAIDMMCIVYKDYTIEKYIGDDTVDCFKLSRELNIWYEAHIHPMSIFKKLWVKIGEI